MFLEQLKQKLKINKIHKEPIHVKYNNPDLVNKLSTKHLFITQNIQNQFAFKPITSFQNSQSQIKLFSTDKNLQTNKLTTKTANATNVKSKNVDSKKGIFKQLISDTINASYIDSGEIGVGTINVSNALNIGSSNEQIGLFVMSGDGSYMYPYDPTNIVLIGSSSLPSTSDYKFQVSGKAYFSDQVRGKSFEAFSDKRLKKNIQQILNPLSIIDKLQGVKFDWKDDNQASSGVIAQEIEQVIPEAVSDETKTKYKSVNYSCIIPYLIESIKELHKRVTKLEFENKNLQSKLFTQ